MLAPSDSFFLAFFLFFLALINSQAGWAGKGRGGLTYGNN